MQIEPYHEYSENKVSNFFNSIVKYKRIALLSLLGFLLLACNFILGIFAKPTISVIEKIEVVSIHAEYLTQKIQYFQESLIHTSKGHFRYVINCNSPELTIGDTIEMNQTPLYNHILKITIPNKKYTSWVIVNIYIVFSFFPLIGMICSILSLIVKNNSYDRMGYQFSLISIILLIFTFVMMMLG